MIVIPNYTETFAGAAAARARRAFMQIIDLNNGDGRIGCSRFYNAGRFNGANGNSEFGLALAPMGTEGLSFSHRRRRRRVYLLHTPPFDWLLNRVKR